MNQKFKKTSNKPNVKERPYSFKTIVAYVLIPVGMGLSAVFGCKPETEKKDDPTNEKITQLTAQYEILVIEFRAAFEPAKTQPYNIASSFDDVFGEEAVKLGFNELKDVIDSSKTVIPTAQRLIDWGGDYANPYNMGILVEKSKILCLTYDQLQELLARTK
jgi:hypothetical protein